MASSLAHAGASLPPVDLLLPVPVASQPPSPGPTARPAGWRLAESQRLLESARHFYQDDRRLLSIAGRERPALRRRRRSSSTTVEQDDNKKKLPPEDSSERADWRAQNGNNPNRVQASLSEGDFEDGPEAYGDSFEWNRRQRQQARFLYQQQHKSKKPVYVSINQKTVNGLLSLLLLLVISTCGCMGNIFVISALTVIESLQTRGNCFLVSLALSQLLVNLLVIPSSAIQIMAANGVDSRSLCGFQWLTLEFSLVVSQLSFLLMALDNYLTFRVSERVTTSVELASRVLQQASRCEQPQHPLQTHQQQQLNSSFYLALPEASAGKAERAQPGARLRVPGATLTSEPQHQASLTSKQSPTNEPNRAAASGRLLGSLLGCCRSLGNNCVKRGGHLRAHLHEEANLAAPSKRARLLSYGNLCGNLKVLVWIILVWLTGFLYTKHQQNFSFTSSKFCPPSSGAPSSSFPDQHLKNADSQQNWPASSNGNIRQLTAGGRQPPVKLARSLSLTGAEEAIWGTNSNECGQLRDEKCFPEVGRKRKRAASGRKLIERERQAGERWLRAEPGLLGAPLGPLNAFLYHLPYWDLGGEVNSGAGSQTSHLEAAPLGGSPAQSRSLDLPGTKLARGLLLSGAFESLSASSIDFHSVAAENLISSRQKESQKDDISLVNNLNHFGPQTESTLQQEAEHKAAREISIRSGKERAPEESFGREEPAESNKFRATVVGEEANRNDEKAKELYRSSDDNEKLVRSGGSSGFNSEHHSDSCHRNKCKFAQLLSDYFAALAYPKLGRPGERGNFFEYKDNDCDSCGRGISASGRHNWSTSRSGRGQRASSVPARAAPLESLGPKRISAAHWGGSGMQINVNYHNASDALEDGLKRLKLISTGGGETNLEPKREKSRRQVELSALKLTPETLKLGEFEVFSPASSSASAKDNNSTNNDEETGEAGMQIIKKIPPSSSLADRRAYLAGKQAFDFGGEGGVRGGSGEQAASIAEGEPSLSNRLRGEPAVRQRRAASANKRHPWSVGAGATRTKLELAPSQAPSGEQIQPPAGMQINSTFPIKPSNGSQLAGRPINGDASHLVRRPGGSYWLVFTWIILLPSFTSAVLFLRSYMLMKKFKLRQCSPIPSSLLRDYPSLSGVGSQGGHSQPFRPARLYTETEPLCSALLDCSDCASNSCSSLEDQNALESSPGRRTSKVNFLSAPPVSGRSASQPGETSGFFPLEACQSFSDDGAGSTSAENPSVAEANPPEVGQLPNRGRLRQVDQAQSAPLAVEPSYPGEAEHFRSGLRAPNELGQPASSFPLNAKAGGSFNQHRQLAGIHLGRPSYQQSVQWPQQQLNIRRETSFSAPPSATFLRAPALFEAPPVAINGDSQARLPAGSAGQGPNEGRHFCRRPIHAQSFHYGIRHRERPSVELARQQQPPQPAAFPPPFPGGHLEGPPEEEHLSPAGSRAELPASELQAGLLARHRSLPHSSKLQSVASSAERLARQQSLQQPAGQSSRRRPRRRSIKKSPPEVATGEPGSAAESLIRGPSNHGRRGRNSAGSGSNWLKRSGEREQLPLPACSEAANADGPLPADECRPNSGKPDAGSERKQRPEKKVVLCTYSYMVDDQLLKSNITVFLVNLLLWLPFLLLSLAGQYKEQLTQELKDSVWWLATINCCSSSYIYALTNRDFREAFNKLFYYCCCKSHVTFQRKAPIVRRQLDTDSKGNLRIHIIPGVNVYSNKLGGLRLSADLARNNGSGTPLSSAAGNSSFVLSTGLDLHSSTSAEPLPRGFRELFSSGKPDDPSVANQSFWTSRQYPGFGRFLPSTPASTCEGRPRI